MSNAYAHDRVAEAHGNSKHDINVLMLFAVSMLRAPHPRGPSHSFSLTWTLYACMCVCVRENSCSNNNAPYVCMCVCARMHVARTCIHYTRSAAQLIFMLRPYYAHRVHITRRICASARACVIYAHSHTHAHARTKTRVFGIYSVIRCTHVCVPAVSGAYIYLVRFRFKHKHTHSRAPKTIHAVEFHYFFSARQQPQPQQQQSQHQHTF